VTGCPAPTVEFTSVWICTSTSLTRLCDLHRYISTAGVGKHSILMKESPCDFNDVANLWIQER